MDRQCVIDGDLSAEDVKMMAELSQKSVLIEQAASDFRKNFTALKEQFEKRLEEFSEVKSLRDEMQRREMDPDRPPYCTVAPNENYYLWQRQSNSLNRNFKMLPNSTGKPINIFCGQRYKFHRRRQIMVKGHKSTLSEKTIGSTETRKWC